MIKRDFTHKFVRDGIEFTVDIPPYVWMYHSGKIDIDINCPRGVESRHKTTFTMDNNSPEDLARFAESMVLKITTCKTCHNKCQQQPKSEYRVNDECEICAKERISAEFDVENKKEAAKELAKDKKMFKDGYKFKAVAWVHAGGDDGYMLMYTKVKPTDAQMKAALKKEGSRVLNDYTITELKF